MASELAAVREQQQAKCATGERIEVLEGSWRGLVTGEQLKQVEARMEGALEVGLREQFHEFNERIKRGDVMKGKVRGK